MEVIRVQMNLVMTKWHVKEQGKSSSTPAKNSKGKKKSSQKIKSKTPTISKR